MNDRAEPETEQRPEPSREELKCVLEKHEKWLGGQEGGQRADLQGADLREAYLNGANLRDANLVNANLQKANLGDADLQGATLSFVDFGGATLFNAKLQGAYLVGAKFLGSPDGAVEDAMGLSGEQFAGADISGATLPAEIAAFDGLGQAEEASRNARKIFLSMLLGCAYAWLTVATTTDVQLLTNTGSSPLPIIQAKVPIAWFYLAAAGILVGLYVYLHLYLQRLWEGLAALPAIFPDGKPLQRKAYPWLLTSVARAHIMRLRDDRPPISRLEFLASVLLAWWAVPLTLAGFWVRFLPRHDWPGTILLILALLAAIWAGTAFYRLARATLRRTAPGALAAEPIAVFVVAVITAAITDTAIGGPQRFELFGYATYANLREAAVSARPDNWWMAKDPDDAIKAANLRGRNLRFADAERAFLVKADLGEANLRRTWLRYANLRGAHLQWANLQQANLAYADLQTANFRNADLRGADLRGADLRGAHLVDAKLQGAWLQGARLQGAKLFGARLEGAILHGAKLQGANLKMANFQEADLLLTDLQGADLSQADLRGANLSNANLRQANLTIANLRDVKGLRQAQLDEACGHDRTRLPEGLTIKPCPKNDQKSKRKSDLPKVGG
jgi:uncharacterized protein YjbI with pentapeptide repeats